MYSYTLTKDALDFLKKAPKKHAKQIQEKIDLLAVDPTKLRSKQLEGFPKLKRITSGEYRIIYSIEEKEITIYVLRIGKRNDGEVYRGLQSLIAKTAAETYEK